MTERAFVALAVLAPIVLTLATLHAGHHGDIEFFHRWYLAVRASSGFYADGPGINYPIVGVLLVSGPARLVDLVVGRPLTLSEYWLVLKATLVVGEIAAILIGERLARQLAQPEPRLLSLCLYALPSSWVGGAYFGQIDVWGTVFLLGAALYAARYWEKGASADLGRALAFLVLAVLTKQLTFFACPALALLLADGLRRHALHRAEASMLGLAMLALVAPDVFLTLPSGSHSHLVFVIAHGSSHGDVVVASGASLWALVASGGTPSSALTFLGISSRTWGWIAFGAAQLAVLAGLWRERSPQRFVIAAGLGELSMALLLTGVHERYLAHAIPLLVLGHGLALTPQHRVTTSLALAVGVVSGLFVLSTLES